MNSLDTGPFVTADFADIEEIHLRILSRRIGLEEHRLVGVALGTVNVRRRRQSRILKEGSGGSIFRPYHDYVRVYLLDFVEGGDEFVHVNARSFSFDAQLAVSALIKQHSVHFVFLQRHRSSKGHHYCYFLTIFLG